MEENPDVRIVIRHMNFITDISEQVALATRLLADPPDIINTAYFIFEKFSMDALFADMNEFLDGPTGINRDDYFDNVFRAAEIGGKLYTVPLMINTNTVTLNKRYFDAIGVDISHMRSLTFSEYIHYFLRARALLPNDNILADEQFSVMSPFRDNRIYDIDAGTVNVNTPEMRELLTLAHSVPHSSRVEFTPQRELRWSVAKAGPSSFPDDSYIDPDFEYNCMYNLLTDLNVPWIYFLQDNPLIKFSHPVFKATDSGENRFRQMTSSAILQNARNKELAWEFLRFCMEYPYTLYIPPFNMNNIAETPGFPVNRAMFETHLQAILRESHGVMTQTHLINITGDDDIDDAELEKRVEYSIYRFRELMEMINSEERVSEPTLHSLIYPDVYLLYTNRHDIDTTLRNIQNRLEIYVAE
jgi:ABC-type glycerol-3-phosphate transport system substrate-binding protein